MCAKQSSIQPARAYRLDSPESFFGRRADLNSSRGSYRVLRSGRQRPLRSVDRKNAGRNASEAIEPRQLFRRVCVPSLYNYDEGSTFNLLIEGHSGVRAHGMYSLRLSRELGRSLTTSHSGQGYFQERKFKEILKWSREVRCFHSSWEVG